MMTRKWKFFWLGVAVVVSVVCTLLSRGEADQPFFEPIHVTIGAPTSAILATSLNNDAYPDLLVVGGDKVFSLRGRGEGYFEVIGSVPAGDHAVDFAQGDLDEDGYKDIVVANHETNYVTVLFGTSGDGFAVRDSKKLEVNVFPHPHAVKLKDINGDGHLDLFVDDRGGEAIKLFVGLGNGTFKEPKQIPVGGDPYRGMLLADINNDGKTDLITPNSDHVAVLLGDGHGSFAQDTALYPGFYPFSAIAADINGDGLMDLAAGSGEGIGRLAVWFKNAHGNFQAGGQYEMAVGPAELAASDLTGNGRSEIIATSYVGHGVVVLTGDEQPEVYGFDLKGNPYGATTGDFNGDGRTDFAIANDGVEFISVFLSRSK
jgi:hypothetical protein